MPPHRIRPLRNPSRRLWRRFAVAAAALALLVHPRSADAQKDRVDNALGPFFQALGGVYGDEGSRLPAQLDALIASLTRWDAALAARERDVRRSLKDAESPAALEAHVVLASLYAERSRFDEALREIDAAISLDATRPPLHQFRALVFQALGRHDEAANSFRAAWLLAPDHPEAAYHLVVHRSPQTTAAEAERALGTLRTLVRDLVRGTRQAVAAPFLTLNAIDQDAGGGTAFAPAHYTGAFDLLFRGDFAGAASALRTAVAADPLVADPAHRSSALTRGITALRQGQISAAIEALETAVAGVPGSSEAHRVAATAYFVDGNIDRSLRHLREAVRLNPRDERSWIAVAQVLDDVGRPLEAVEELRRAVAAVPEAGAARWMLSVLSAKRDQTSETDVELIAMADRLVLLAGRADMIGRVARLAQDHLDFDRAISLLERQVTLTPNAADAHKALGSAYIEQSREDVGFAELAIALSIAPADAGTLATIGLLRLNAGELPEAIEALQKALALDPASRTVAQALGQALVRAGREKEGRTLMEQAARLQEGFTGQQRRIRTAGALRSQAEQQMADGMTAEAIATWQQIIPLEPRYSDNHLRIAEALVAQKRFDEAASHLQTAISLDGGIDAHRRLADAYALLGRDADAARERQRYRDLRLAELRRRAGEAPAR